MSDTRDHTTRDQLADLLRDLGAIYQNGGTYTDAADALLASDAITAVRAAAVAETTAAIEAVLNPEGHPNGRDYGRAAVWSDEIREVLSGGRTALDTTLAQARADALREAADALNVEGVGFRPGWGSGNEGDQGALDALGKAIQWLRDRADTGAAESCTCTCGDPIAGPICHHVFPPAEEQPR